MIVTLIFAWHIAGVIAMMVGFGILIWMRIQNMPGSAAIYQMIDTNEPTADKELYNNKNEGNQRYHTINNGYITNAGISASEHQMLDSESEEA